MPLYKALSKVDTVLLSICQRISNGSFNNKPLNPNYISSFFFTGAGILALSGIVAASLVSMVSLLWGMFMLPMIIQSFQLSLLTNLWGKEQKETDTNAYIAVEEIARIMQMVLVLFVFIMLLFGFNSVTFLYFSAFFAYWVGMNFKACFLYQTVKEEEEEVTPENPWS